MRLLKFPTVSNDIIISDKKFKRFVKAAYNASKKSEGRCKHVSLLVYSGKIVSTGVNLLKTDTFAYKLYKYAYIHSELNTIKKAPYGLPIDECELFNFRVSKNGDKFLLARPCPSCIKLIDAFGITNVYYTDNSNTLIRLIKS